MEFPSKEEFEELPRDMQISTIMFLRNNYPIKEIASRFQFRNMNSYYYWLKKLKIYDDVTRKIDVIDLLVKEEESSSERVSEHVDASFNGVQFMFNKKQSGVETAALLKKIAHFIEDDNDEYALELAVVKVKKK